MHSLRQKRGRKPKAKPVRPVRPYRSRLGCKPGSSWEQITSEGVAQSCRIILSTIGFQNAQDVRQTWDKRPREQEVA